MSAIFNSPFPPFDPSLGDGDSIKQTQSALVLENLISQFLYSKAADGQTESGSGAKK